MTEKSSQEAARLGAGESICISLLRERDNIIRAFAGRFPETMLDACLKPLDECIVEVAGLSLGDVPYEDVLSFIAGCGNKG